MARIRAAGMLAAVAITAACGTTVSGRATGQDAGSLSATGGGQGSGASPLAGAGGGGTGSYGGSVSSTAGQTGGGTSSLRATGAGVGSAGGASSVGGGAGLTPSRTPGVDSKYLYIGLAYSSDANSANQAIGASGAQSSYDLRDVWQAVFNYANTHGGFAGRQIKPVWFQVHATDDANTDDQAACSTWTQDHKVFVMAAVDPVTDACAEKAHAIGIGTGTSETYKRYPHLVGPGEIALDRLGSVTVNGLSKVGYFTGKLGLVTWDDPDYRRAVATGYLPALAQHGLKPTDTAYIMVPQQLGALGDMSAAVSNAITKFRSDGIDHVIIQDGAAGVWGGTGLTFEWMNQADSQRYYPRYGQNSYNSPGWSALPSDQMDKAIAIDQSDYDKSKDAGWKLNAVREKCYQIEKDAGFPVSSGNPQDEVNAGRACDDTFLIQRTVNLLSVIDADSFVAALPQLGSSLGSAVYYGSKFVPGRRDSGSLVRPEEYYASCQCLKYIGPPYDAS